jgi:hypothetical protein
MRGIIGVCVVEIQFDLNEFVVSEQGIARNQSWERPLSLGWIYVANANAFSWRAAEVIAASMQQLAKLFTGQTQ